MISVKSVLAAFLLLPALCHGEITILIATNNSPEDVQNRIDAASSVITNSTIILLSGSNTWSTLDVQGTAKNIVIRSAPGLTAEIKHGYTTKKMALRLNGLTSNNIASIRNLRLWPGTGANQGDGFITMNTVGHAKAALRYLDFTNAVGRNIVWYGYGSGLVDYCYVHNGSVNDQAVQAFTHLGSQANSASWAEGPNWGNITNRVYFENNINNFTNHTQDSSVEGYRGAKYCVRRHLNVNDAMGCHGVDSDHFIPDGSRSGHSAEIYDITNIVTAASQLSQWTHFRGGSVLAYNIKMIRASGATANTSLILALYRATSNNIFPNYSGDGFANGASRIDGNTAITDGTGTHTGANNQSLLADSTQLWAVDYFVTNFNSRPLYIWNRTDGSKGLVTANDATTVTATLSGGTDNDWDTGDDYVVTWGYPALDQPGTTGPTTTNSTHSTQVLSPCYESNNFWGLSFATMTNNINFVVGNVFTNTNPNGTAFITSGVEYRNDEMPAGYIPAPYPHPFAETNIVSPTFVNLTAGSSQTFTSTGGFPDLAGTYLWQIATNNTGGSINSTTGEYTAGPTIGIDVVRAWDRMGNYHDVQASVVSIVALNSGQFVRRRR